MNGTITNEAITNAPVLAGYDLRGIQEFIFRTNVLKEIVGASGIVADIFDYAAQKAVDEYDKVNIRFDWLDYDTFEFADNESILLERLYTGAGNTFIAFRNKALCDRFNRIVSKYILENSYSLSFAIAQVPVDFREPYAQTYQKLQNALSAVKNGTPPARMQGGFPITRQDTRTGFPLSEFSRFDNTPVCRESKLKQDWYAERYKAPDEVKSMESMIAEKGVDSQVAIVHIDGNNMGKRFFSEMKGTTDFKSAVEKVRAFSKTIDITFKNALNNVQDRVSDRRWPDETEDALVPPMRVIINSGDDITFICNARLSISLSEAILANLDKYKACAGIAICNSHFPFYSAYKLADACCGNAKKRAKSLDPANPGSFIDFQICKSMSASEYSDSYRDRNYRPEGISLLAKPYCIDDSLSVNDNRHIDYFKKAHRHFSSAEFARNSALVLRNAYAKSQNEAEATHEKLASRGKPMPFGNELYINRENAKEALYYDALEMLDLYVDINDLRIVENE